MSLNTFVHYAVNTKLTPKDTGVLWEDMIWYSTFREGTLLTKSPLLRCFLSESLERDHWVALQTHVKLVLGDIAPFVSEEKGPGSLWSYGLSETAIETIHSEEVQYKKQKALAKAAEEMLRLKNRSFFQKISEFFSPKEKLFS